MRAFGAARPSDKRRIDLPNFALSTRQTCPLPLPTRVRLTRSRPLSDEISKGRLVNDPRLSDSTDALPVDERRRDARIRQRSLHSSIGPVIDLSRSGIRVLGTKRLRGAVEVVVFNRAGPHLHLRARVVWSRRLGFRNHLVGLEFYDLNENVARQLAKIGTIDFFSMLT